MSLYLKPAGPKDSLLDRLLQLLHLLLRLILVADALGHTCLREIHFRKMAISGASRKAREGWGFGRVLLLAASLCLVGTALLFLYELGGTSNISGKHVGSAKLTALVSRLRGGSGRFVRTTEVGDIFGKL